MKKKQSSLPHQSQAFVEAAVELGCDEDPAHFEEKLKKVAAHKQTPELQAPKKADARNGKRRIK